MSKKAKVSNNTPSPDITKRKQLEEQTGETEELYRNMVELSPDGIVAADLKGMILLCNTAATRMSGYSKDEMVGKHFSRIGIIRLRDVPKYLKIFTSTQRGGIHKPFELPFYRKDGTIVWTEVRVSSLKLAGKTVIQSTLRDITERKRAEKALRESEERFRDLFENANDLIQTVAPDGHFLYVNKTWWQVLGYSEEEVARLTLWDIIHPDFIPHCREIFQKVISGETVNNIEAVFVAKDGKLVPVEGNANCRFEGGKPVATRGIFRDVTERKRLEEALRESEERFSKAFRSSPVPITISTLREGRLIDVNESFLRIFGYHRKEVIGRTVVELGIWPRPEGRYEMARMVQKYGVVRNLEREFRTKPGEIRVVLFSAELVDLRGEPCMIAVLRDITERKQMEQELMEKTKELETASQAKSEFLAHMSHELRTPLNIISGFCQLMVDEVPGEINQEQSHCLSDILASSEQLVSLINGVLDLSKIESGKMELKLKNVALTEVVEPLTRTMMPILTPRKQSLDIEIEEGLPPVLADKTKIRQVFLNLLSNSAKFTPDGGKLKVEAVKDGDWCQVSVIDNGIGINKEDLERIFEPFYQLDNPLTKERNGTGLGLTLVKQIVERHGGRIWVESEYRKGSKFTFTLPLATSD